MPESSKASASPSSHNAQKGDIPTRTRDIESKHYQTLNANIPMKAHPLGVEGNIKSSNLQMLSPHQPPSKRLERNPTSRKSLKIDFNDPKTLPDNVLARSGSHSLLFKGNPAPGKDEFKP